MAEQVLPLPSLERTPLPGLRHDQLARRLVIAWALALGLLLILGLESVPLFDVDEGAFSEATREMLASGDWSHTTLNGEPRWDKPILIYWLQAASVSLFGLDELALRLPSALATWGWTVALALFAWPRWGLTVALAGASLLYSQLGVLMIGRAATADALLNLWITLAALDLWRHVESGPDGPAPHARRSRLALRRAALFIGLGVLTKGPVALLVTGAPLLLWMASQPGARGRRLLALVSDGPAWCLFLLSWLPWYGAMLDRYGMAFVEGFLLRHNLDRFSAPMEGHGGSAAYYLLLLPVLLLPWSALLPFLALRLRAWWLDGLSRWLMIWAGFVLVIFSLSGTKLPHYVLYGMSPLVLLLGRLMAEGIGGPAGQRARWHWPLAASLLSLPWVLVGVTAWAQIHAAALPDPRAQLLLASAPDWRRLIGPAASISLLQAAAWWARWRMNACPLRTAEDASIPRPAWADALPWMAGGIGFVLFTTQALIPWWGTHLQGPIKRLAHQAQVLQRLDRANGLAPAPVVQWGLHQPSFSLYLEQEVPRREPRPGEWALARWDRVAPSSKPQIDRRPIDFDWQPLARDGAYVLLKRCSTTPAPLSAHPC